MKINVKNIGERRTKNDKKVNPIERFENQIGSHSLIGLGTQSRLWAKEAITDFIS